MSEKLKIKDVAIKALFCLLIAILMLYSAYLGFQLNALERRIDREVDYMLNTDAAAETRLDRYMDTQEAQIQALQDQVIDLAQRKEET